MTDCDSCKQGWQDRGLTEEDVSGSKAQRSCIKKKKIKQTTHYV